MIALVDTRGSVVVGASIVRLPRDGEHRRRCRCVLADGGDRAVKA
jgi:hypothetical protein